MEVLWGSMRGMGVTMTQAEDCGGFEWIPELEPSGAVHRIGEWTPYGKRNLWEKESELLETSERTFYKLLIHWSIACEIQNMHGTG